MRIVMRNEGGGFAASIYGVMPQSGIFLLSRIRRLSVCKKDFSLALEMTIRESNVYQSPVTSILPDYTIFAQEKPPECLLRGVVIF